MIKNFKYLFEFVAIGIMVIGSIGMCWDFLFGITF